MGHEEEWLTSEEACMRLGIAWRTLYNLHRNSPGFPIPRRIGRTLLWRTAGLDAWRAEHPSRKSRTDEV